MILETECGLYELAKKAQNTDQILRDLAEKKKNAELGYVPYAVAQKPNVVTTTSEQLCQITPAYVPRQVTPAVASPVGPTVNSIQCFNCRGYGHVFRDCRMPRNRELTVRNIEEDGDQDNGLEDQEKE